MPGLAVTQQSSGAWAEMGAQAERAWNTGWGPDQRADGLGSFTVNTSPSSSSLTLTSSGDGTTGSGNSFYSIGRRVRVIQSASTAYGKVAGASFGGGVTTVTLGSFTTGVSTGLTTGAITSAAVGAVIPDADLIPINTSGDLVYGTSSATVSRLAIGTTGSVLVASTGVPTWLVPGTTGTLLSISGGVPTWVSLLGTASAKLSADVATTSTGTYQDIVSVSLTTGTWWVYGEALLAFTAAGGLPAAVTAKLWDGSTTLASVQYWTTAANIANQMTAPLNLSAIVPVGVAATWKISSVGYLNGPSTTIVMLAAAQFSPQGNNATYLNAIRISAST